MPAPECPEDAWYYMDDKDTVHGPHAGAQMLAWLINGYFDVNLRIRREGQTEFLPLMHLTQLGGKVPFAAEDPRASANLRQAQSQTANPTLTALHIACNRGPSTHTDSATPTPAQTPLTFTAPAPGRLRDEDGPIIINGQANGAQQSSAMNGRAFVSAGSTPNGPSPRGIYGESGPSSPSPAAPGSEGGFPDAASDFSFSSELQPPPAQAHHMPPPTSHHPFILHPSAMQSLNATMGGIPALPHPQGPPPNERQILEQQRTLQQYRLAIEAEQYKLQLMHASLPRKVDAATSTADLGPRPRDAVVNTEEARGTGDAVTEGTQTLPMALPLSQIAQAFAALGIQITNDLPAS